MQLTATINSYFKQIQTVETPMSVVQRQHYTYRYTFARSAECQANGDPGQDYMTFRESANRLAVVLCDGVSESFYGDLAARLLGDRLVQWLWEQDPGDTSLIEKLTVYLTGLVPEAARAVADVRLPNDLPQLLWQVLEEKRSLGSETMFTAVLVDWAASQMVVASMGDMRARVWSATGSEITTSLGERPDSSQRWSTLLGLKGQPRIHVLDLRSTGSFALYSDGLARIDDNHVDRINNDDLAAVIQQTFADPRSDDISFFEIRIGTKILSFEAANEMVQTPLLKSSVPSSSISDLVPQQMVLNVGNLPVSSEVQPVGHKHASGITTAPSSAHSKPITWYVLATLLLCLTCFGMVLILTQKGVIGGWARTPTPPVIIEKVTRTSESIFTPKRTDPLPFFATETVRPMTTITLLSATAKAFPSETVTNQKTATPQQTITRKPTLNVTITLNPSSTITVKNPDQQIVNR